MNFDKELREKMLNDIIDKGIKARVDTSHYHSFLPQNQKKHDRTKDNHNVDSNEGTYVEKDFVIRKSDGTPIGELTQQEAMLLYSYQYRPYSMDLAFTDIVHRRELINKYGSEEKACEELKSDFESANSFDRERIERELELVDGTIFKGSQKSLAELIDREYNSYINCGGYALEIFGKIYGYIQESFFVGLEKDAERVMLVLLENYKFIRLLGDSKLKEDEYMVMFRKGHHFIKVNDDGTITEKDENKPPKAFNKWPQDMQNEQDIVFAVKREHGRNVDDSEFLPSKYEDKVKTFENLALNALKNKEAEFTYQDENYSISAFKDGEGVISSKKGDVANIYYDGEDGEVEVFEEKKKEVYKFSPTIPLKIENGRLVNFKDYKQEVEVEI
jgi:hypothetical protein